MPLDVPAQVQYAPTVQQHILVEGGTNWDFSRAAQAVPVVQLADPEPVTPPPSASTPVKPAAPAIPAYQTLEGIPATSPIFTLGFTPNSAAITRAKQKALRALSKETPFVVVAYPQSADTHAVRVCKARARVVVALLRASGHKVEGIKALGALKDSSPDVIRAESIEIIPLGAPGA